jgi:putative peptidoglycan lipid II flippase
VVVLPYFSDLARENDHAKLSDTLMTTLRMVVLVFTPIGASLFMLRYPVVRLLFERGEFDVLSTQLTVTALGYYAVGIVGFAVEPILLRSYFSMSDTTTPAIMEVVTIAVHVAVIYIFLGTLNHGSIALAFTLSKTMKVLTLYALLKQKIGDIQFSHNLRFLGKISIATVLMILAMAGYHGWFSSYVHQSAFLPQALLIGTSGSVGALTFLIASIVLNVREIHLILHAIAEYVKQHFRT